MRYSTCCADDFLHPRFVKICQQLHHPFRWHRKLWEWVFIVHHLFETGLVKPGSRGLVFGVGKERLPALFAGLGANIVATDAPIDIGVTDGWIETGQHVSGLGQIRYTDVVDGALFDRNVSFQTCDMRNIDPELNGFDFNWSSCCFEHLGSLGAGMEFVINAVENTLREGGVAVHTTEYNLSSNDHTIDEGETVIYRRRDIDELVSRLRDRGHLVKAIVIAPNSHYFDFHVDTPPFTDLFHLKLQLWEYVSTSIGIVVQRGASLTS
jgi:SAM-dependent methyltransferase